MNKPLEFQREVKLRASSNGNSTGNLSIANERHFQPL